MLQITFLPAKDASSLRSAEFGACAVARRARKLRSKGACLEGKGDNEPQLRCCQNKHLPPHFLSV